MAARAKKRMNGKRRADAARDPLAETVHRQQHTGNRDTPDRGRRAGTRAGAENVEPRGRTRSRRDRPVEQEADKDIKEGGMEQTVRRRSKRGTRR